MKLVEELALVQKRQDCDPPAQQGLAVLVADIGGKVVVQVVEVVKRHADLLEVIGRMRPVAASWA